MKTLLSVIAIYCMTTALEAMCEKTTLDKQFAMSDVVFTGRAIDKKVVSEGGGQLNTLTTFAVEEMWKGTVEKAITIQTCGGTKDGVSYMCSENVYFYVGMQYLIFAVSQPASRPTLGTSACLPTGLIERAQPTLQWLAAKPRIVSR